MAAVWRKRGAPGGAVGVRERVGVAAARPVLHRNAWRAFRIGLAVTHDDSGAAGIGPGADEFSGAALRRRGKSREREKDGGQNANRSALHRCPRHSSPVGYDAAHGPLVNTSGFAAKMRP